MNDFSQTQGFSQAQSHPQTPNQVCRHCTRLLDAGAHKCACGAPTVLASFKERAEYEVTQWRAYKQRMASEQQSA